ncbi:MAG: hypothetical protein LC803_18985 [Acidobacteria bacterium]|nr:hypothetical protein [Acidobacteriota bacterium]
MKKADKKLLEDNLGKALAAPKKKPRQDLDALLEEYDDKLVTPPNPTLRGVTPPNPVAPSRDFNKRANSLDRVALPSGIFQGSSKKLYDALYVRTRGAIVPKRTVRATKRELSDWSGIRNVKTIDSHLRYFSAIGLVISEWQRGQNDGCLYEVLLPEETSGLFVARSRGVTPPNPTSPHVTPPDGELPQNSGLPPHQNLGSPHLTDLAVKSTTSGDTKTSFKTKEENSDDEAGARRLADKMIEAERELTGKVSTSGEKWEDLAEVLISELRIAAARTTVSNVPAFLAEHLRRRLWKVDKERAIELAADATGQERAVPALMAEEKRKCPDCAGVGFWYPEGQDKGVAKCKHLRLKSVPSGDEGT